MIRNDCCVSVNQLGGQSTKMMMMVVSFYVVALRFSSYPYIVVIYFSPSSQFLFHGVTAINGAMAAESLASSSGVLLRGYHHDHNPKLHRKL